MPIHLGRRPSREGWISFETDPFLSGTKARLRGRCLPCLTALYEALKAGARTVELREAWNCWKVTAVVADEAACLRILEVFGERYPADEVRGKLGGGVGRETAALVFHAETEQRRDEVAALLSAVLAEILPGVRAVASRGCANPYERLLGPWQEWKRVSEVLSPERAAEVRETLRRSLYR